MKWTVVWSPNAEDELASIWSVTTDRSTISMAANAIDQALRWNPTTVGESREEDERVHHIAPLGILYRITDQDRKIEVLHVWAFR